MSDARQERDVEVAAEPHENVDTWGTRVTNRNLPSSRNDEQIKFGAKSCLSSCSFSEDMKIEIHKIVILPIVLHWYKTWSIRLLAKI